MSKWFRIETDEDGNEIVVETITGSTLVTAIDKGDQVQWRFPFFRGMVQVRTRFKPVAKL